MRRRATTRMAVMPAVLAVLLCGSVGQGYSQTADIAPRLEDRYRRGAMIRAKIFSRMMMEQQSLELYRDLRRMFPDDLPIWKNYVWSLTDAGLHDEALAELRQLLLQHPEDIEAKTILASVYYELGEYTRTYALYEEVLQVNPSDIRVWTGYARSRSAAGDWTGGLICWQRVAELDVTSESAGRNIRSILREHLPQMEADYRYHSSEKTSSIQTYTLRYRRHITPPARLEFTYLRQEVREEGTGGEADFSSELHLPAVSLHYEPPGMWKATAGLGYFTGLGEGVTYSLELERQLDKKRSGMLRASFDYNRPWMDSISAAKRHGYLHRAGLEFRWRSRYALDCRLGAEHQAYYLDDDLEYGRRWRFTAALYRRLSDRPYLTLGYRIRYTDSDYEDEGYTPVSLSRSETVHSIPLYFEIAVTDALSMTAGASIGRVFESNTTYIHGSSDIKVRIGARVDLSVGFYYSNEQGDLGADDGFTVRSLLTIVL